MAKYNHLTIDERRIISERLSQHASFKAIAAELGKDCTTISKEVRKHRYAVQTGSMGHPYNNCKYRYTCNESWLCSECTYRRAVKRCRLCNRCNTVCPKYEPDICLKLSKPPYVCNGCPDKHHACTLQKQLYIPKNAQNDYELTLRESRTGICLTEDEIRHLDELFSPLLKKQQSIHHICVNHRDSVMVSESTIYRMVDYCLFNARNIDMPRKVRFAPRRKKKEYKVDKTCRIGRTFEDFRHFIAANPSLPLTQIDSVEGTKGGKVLLTIHFVQTECMLAFLRESNDSLSVINVIDSLYEKLNKKLFCSIMPVLLADNGSEFSNPKALEYDATGFQRTRVFYCDPSAPAQKGSCERNHEFIRMFIPKGTSLDHFTQADIDLMMSHINSYGRPSLGDKSPYQAMAFMHGAFTPGLFNLHYIQPDDVTLNAGIWKKEVSEHDF